MYVTMSGNCVTSSSTDLVLHACALQVCYCVIYTMPLCYVYNVM